MKRPTFSAAPVLFAVAMLASAGGCKSTTLAEEEALTRDLRVKLQNEVDSLEGIRRREAQREEAIQVKASRVNDRYEAEQAIEREEPQKAFDIIERVYALSAAGQQAIEPQEDASLFLVKAEALERLGRFEEATKALEYALAQNPSLRAARRELGRSYLALGHPDEALKWLGKELADGYRDATVLRLVAQANLDLATRDPARIDAAIAALEQALVEQPLDVDLREELVALELDSGRYALAARHLEAMRTARPLDPDVLERIAGCHLQLRDEEKAIELLDLASSVRPLSGTSARELAALLERRGYHARAAVILRHAAGDEMSQDDAVKVGLLFVRAGQFDNAEAALRAVAPNAAGYAEAQAALVRVCLRKGKVDEALEAYGLAQKSASADGSLHSQAGHALLEKGKHKEAIDSFSRAAASVGAQAEGLAGLADTFRSQGALAASRLYYRRALSVNPLDTGSQAALKQVESEIELRGLGDLSANADGGKAEPVRTSDAGKKG